MKICLLALCLGLLPLAAVAQSDTTGQKLSHAPGYTMGSNVAGYLQLSSDICDIKTAIGDGPTPPYADAQRIYQSGKNSRKSDGSIRTLRELALRPYRNETTWEQYAAYFGSPTFMDTPIMAAFNGTTPYTRVGQRNETITKGNEIQIQTIYLLHEIDETTTLIRANRLAAKDGAPHNIDETWAIYAGIKPACSLWGSANRRAAEFGTMEDCTTSRVNAAMTTLHRQMYETAQKGDEATFLQQREEVIRLFLITYIQAVLKYAELVDRAVAKGELDDAYTEQAEGAMFFRTIEPFIAEVSPEAVTAVKSVMAVGVVPKNNTLQTVRTALEPTYPALRITAADIGSYSSQPLYLRQPELRCTPPAGAAAPAGSGAGAYVVGAGRSVLLAMLVLVLALLV